MRACFVGLLALFTFALVTVKAPVSSANSPTPASSPSQDAPVSFESLWSKYFPGSPVVPDLKHNFDRLIDYDQSACGNIVHTEVQAINDYGVAAVLSKNGDAKKAYRAIQTLIKTADPNCAETTLKVYAVGAIFLLDDQNYNPRKGSSIGSNGAINVTGIGPNPPSPSQTLAYHNLELTYLVAALANLGKLHFLAGAVTFAQSGNRSMLGGYDCANSAIYLDPSLPPMDLGATFLHELDHLFLDKQISVQALEKYYPSATKGIDWRAYVLDDELVAILHGALIQKQMSNLVRNFTEVNLGLFDFTIPHRAYQLTNDLDLTSKKGILSSMDDAINFLPVGVLLEMMTGQNQAFEKLGVVTTNVKSDSSGYLWHRFDDTNLKVLDLINGPYFTTNALSEDELDTLNPMGHGEEIVPLVTWQRSVGLTVKLLADNKNPPSAQMAGAYGLEDPAHGSFALKGETDLFMSDGPVTQIVIQNVDRLVSRIDDILSLTAAPSQVCSLYLDAVSRGDLQGYIGTEIPLDALFQGGTGTLPGAGGMRPGAGGMRPGAGGMRPGAGGMRPGVGGLRPCLSLKTSFRCSARQSLDKED